MSMDFMKSLAVAASGLRAQMGRMRIITENIANADSVAEAPGGDPYRRRIVTFYPSSTARLAPTSSSSARCNRQFRFPGQARARQPGGHAQGDVKYPNVNTLVELTDLRDAQRSYEANLNVVTATRKMLQLTIDILKT